MMCTYLILLAVRNNNATDKTTMRLKNRCGGEHKDWEEWVKDKSREESLANLGEGPEEETTATSVAA